jgi:hypothetical protein
MTDRRLPDLRCPCGGLRRSSLTRGIAHIGVRSSDVNGSVVLLAAEVYSPNDFDTEMSAVQPIIDSIVWE